MAAQNAGDFGRFPKVITAYLTNFVYFFAPFMLAHGLALCFRPWLILDPRDDRGPWEFLWHSLLDRTTSDPYNLVVYGWYHNFLVNFVHIFIPLLFQALFWRCFLPTGQVPSFTFASTMPSGRSLSGSTRSSPVQTLH